MNDGPSTHDPAGGPSAGSYGTIVPPTIDLDPFTPAELCELIRGGEHEADLCEEILVRAGRAAGAYDLTIGEGLAVLRAGDRVAELGFHFSDYAREVLGMARSTAESHALLARRLRDRPLLRAAVRAGRVLFRAAQVVVPVAKGEAEPAWVERASTETVRALEKAVREAGPTAVDEDETWVRLRVELRPEERAVVDEALLVADKLEPGRSRAQRLEAMAQEFLGAAGAAAGEPEDVRLGGSFRARRTEPDDAAREEELEKENDRWSHLPAIAAIAAPNVDFWSMTSVEEIDRELRRLVALRDRWDRYIGWAAATLLESRVFQLLGFASFRQYVKERLGLPARAIEQRARLELALWHRPALREAQAAGLSYAKLLLLARLPDDREVRAWTGRARSMTCIELARKLEADEDGQMRAQRKLAVPLPRSTALVLAAAIAAARRLSDTVISDGKALALVAQHFLDVWRPHVKPARTRSQKVRERDVWCQIPGCSHRAGHAHHKKFRSQGGGDEFENLTGVCPYHHQRCIHEGHLWLDREAPGGPAWRLRGGAIFTGGVEPLGC